VKADIARSVTSSALAALEYTRTGTISARSLRTMIYPRTADSRVSMLKKDYRMRAA
jgi:hypothetical protein